MMTSKTDARKLLTRHPANPLLDPRDFPGVHALFNPSPVLLPDGRTTALLVSCVVYDRPERSFRETRLATSDDGVRFALADGPLIDQDALPPPIDRFGGIIDCRVSRMEDGEYLILTPQGTGEAGFAGCCTAMYRTRDFSHVEFVDVVALPFNRGSSVFPERIGGSYWRLDRPGEGDAKGTIWLSRSPDLVHWGGFRPLLAGGWGLWNSGKIGPTPPIRVPEGWLVLLHGVDTEPCDGPHYFIGACLLAADDPVRVLGRTRSPLLSPEEPYETNGHVDNVVFSCGALADAARDELRLYYGAADTRVCLATGSLSAVVAACLEGR